MIENTCCCERNHACPGPEDLLKFSVLKDVVVDYDTAVRYVKQKSDVPGEPCVVRYCIDGSLYRKDVSTNIGVVFGIGNSYGSDPFIITSEIQKLVTNSYIDLDGSLYNIPDAIQELQSNKIDFVEAQDIAEGVLAEYISDTSTAIPTAKDDVKSWVESKYIDASTLNADFNKKEDALVVEDDLIKNLFELAFSYKPTLKTDSKSIVGAINELYDLVKGNVPTTTPIKSTMIETFNGFDVTNGFGNMTWNVSGVDGLYRACAVVSHKDTIGTGYEAWSVGRDLIYNATRNVLEIRAKHAVESIKPNVKITTNTGLSSLRFNWNVPREEVAGSVLELGVYVNGSKVATISVDYDTYINTERVVNTLTLEDLNYDGTTVVEIVNDTVYEGNSDRKIFAISNIELISKN